MSLTNVVSHVASQVSRITSRHVAVAATTLVACVAFVVSFVGLEDYGRRVMLLGDMSPLVPIGVDGLTLCAVAVTQIMRHDRWYARSYAWLVFIVAAAMSVAAQMSHAINKGMSPAGVAGTMAVPVVMALGMHLVIFALRSSRKPVNESKPAKTSHSPPTPPAPKTVAAKGGVSKRTMQRRAKAQAARTAALPGRPAPANQENDTALGGNNTHSGSGNGRVLGLVGSGGKTPD